VIVRLAHVMLSSMIHVLFDTHTPDLIHEDSQ